MTTFIGAQKSKNDSKNDILVVCKKGNWIIFDESGNILPVKFSGEGLKTLEKDEFRIIDSNNSYCKDKKVDILRILLIKE